MNMSPENEGIVADGSVLHPVLEGIPLNDPNIFIEYADMTSGNVVPPLPGFKDDYGDAGVINSKLAGIPLTDPMVGTFVMFLEEDLTPEDDPLPPDAGNLDPSLIGLKYSAENFGVEYLKRTGKWDEYISSFQKEEKQPDFEGPPEDERLSKMRSSGYEPWMKTHSPPEDQLTDAEIERRREIRRKQVAEEDSTS